MCASGFVRLFLAAVLLGGAADVLHAQGSAGIDPGFAANTNGIITAIAAQADGKVYIGGTFTTVNGVARSRIARLNTDGSVDGSFVSSAVFGVSALLVQADGKIVVAGDLLQRNDGIPAFTHLGRLNPNGTVDAGFAPLPNGPVFRIVAQPDGHLFVTGSFAQIDGGNRPQVARLNADGKIDRSFVPDLDVGAQVTGIGLLADNKVLVAYSVIQDINTRRFPIVRLDTNGRREGGFSASTNEAVYALAAQSDGRILIGGEFAHINGIPHRAFARLEPSGALDASFNFPVGNAFDATVRLIIVQPDDKLLVDLYGRLNADGSPDGTYGRVFTSLALLQPDGSLITALSTDVRRIVDISPFFIGETALGDSIYFLTLPNGNVFGYYGVLSDPRFIYHFDLGYEYIFNANDDHAGVYLYDFKSSGFFYTSPTFPFPYLYDFNLKTFLYYYPDPNDTEHYNTDGIRYFYNFATGKVITK